MEMSSCPTLGLFHSLSPAETKRAKVRTSTQITASTDTVAVTTSPPTTTTPTTTHSLMDEPE